MIFKVWQKLSSLTYILVYAPFDDRFKSCKFTRFLDLLFEHVITLDPKAVVKYRKKIIFASHTIFHFVGPIANNAISRGIFYVREIYKMKSTIKYIWIFNAYLHISF